MAKLEARSTIRKKAATIIPGSNNQSLDLGPGMGMRKRGTTWWMFKW
jgi:hypothetical protein